MKESEIVLLCSILSTHETNRQYEILRIFDKLYKGVRARLLKKAIKDNIETFKQTNGITDLKVYKRK